LTTPQQPPAPVPQPVLSPPTGTAIFLVVRVKPGGEQVVRGLLPDLAGLQRSVGARAPAGALTCVAGIGSVAWDRLFSGPRPAGLHPFPELAGAKYIALATPGDLFFHIKATSMNLCFEMTAQIMERLSGAVTVEDEVHGFRYFEERDLLGFVGGVENAGGQAAAAAVLVGPEDPWFAGGSYVIAQKYLHDMRAWNALRSEEQEKVLGRTKLANIPLPAGARPANSHVALTGTTGPGVAQRQILRDKMPFGSAGRGEFGTYFVGYAASPGVTERMLANMFIGDPPGNYDRILDFSAAVTGGLFFVPSADFLRHPPGPPGLPARATAVRPTAVRPTAVPATAVPATAVQPTAVQPTAVQPTAVPAPAVPAPAVPAPAVREPDLADETAPPGIPHQPGTIERVDSLTRSGPAVTIPPRV
jgi:putative iron-dependent peroxidase